MISASLVEVLSLVRGWLESKARTRFAASLKNGTLSVECSILNITDTAIGLHVTGQPRGIPSIRLSGCKVFFGADDAPADEREMSGFHFDTGLLITTDDGESLWLLEIMDGASVG